MTTPGAERRRVLREIAAAYGRALGKWQVKRSAAELQRLASDFYAQIEWPNEDTEFFAQAASLSKSEAKRVKQLVQKANAAGQALRGLPPAAATALKYEFARMGSGFDGGDLHQTLDEVALVIERLLKRRRAKGRSRMPKRAVHIAAYVIGDFERLTIKNANRDLSKDGRGGPTILVHDLFTILGIANTARTAVARALEQRACALKPKQTDSSPSAWARRRPRAQK